MKPKSSKGFQLFGRGLVFKQENYPVNNFENWQYDFRVLLCKKSDPSWVKIGFQFSVLR